VNLTIVVVKPFIYRASLNLASSSVLIEASASVEGTSSSECREIFRCLGSKLKPSSEFPVSLALRFKGRDAAGGIGEHFGSDELVKASLEGTVEAPREKELLLMGPTESAVAGQE
jgi:hypothetical protein